MTSYCIYIKLNVWYSFLYFKQSFQECLNGSILSITAMLSQWGWWQRVKAGLVTSSPILQWPLSSRRYIYTLVPLPALQYFWRLVTLFHLHLILLDAKKHLKLSEQKTFTPMTYTCADVCFTFFTRLRLTASNVLVATCMLGFSVLYPADNCIYCKCMTHTTNRVTKVFTEGVFYHGFCFC